MVEPVPLMSWPAAPRMWDALNALIWAHDTGSSFCAGRLILCSDHGRKDQALLRWRKVMLQVAFRLPPPLLHGHKGSLQALIKGKIYPLALINGLTIIEFSADGQLRRCACDLILPTFRISLRVL
jgi:hypothetical protein